MKHRFCTALMFVALALFVTGCSSQTLDAKLDAVEDAVDQRLDVIEDTIEGDVRITPAPVPKADIPKVVSDTSAPQTNTTRLTKEQAQTIALDHAGVTAADVSWLHTEYGVDDGVPEYDVQFHQGRWEYEYEIHAETGAILSCDIDD